MPENSPISVKQVAETIAIVDALDFEARSKRVEDIFERQPTVLGTVIQLHSVGVDYSTQEHALYVLLVLYECFARHVKGLPKISQEMVQVALDRDVARHKFYDDETPEEAARLQQLEAREYPERNVLAFVVGYLSEHLPNHSRENELAIHACTAVMDAFVKAKERAFTRGKKPSKAGLATGSRNKSRSRRRRRRLQ
jgi:hypothetical protein